MNSTNRAGGSPLATPWVQLTIGIICMVMVANLQYGWTLFVNPINDKYHWGKASIQVAFTIFVLLETWLVPFEGWLVDKFGPRWMIVIGGALCGIAWVINAKADSLAVLYVAAAIGGVGAGAVYGTCIGNALKWFPDRRGLAAGLTAAGFGAGSALTIVPIANMIKSSGYEQTFLTFGLFQGITVVVLGFLILAPAAAMLELAPKVTPGAGRRHIPPQEMVTTPVFWVMYVMFVMMAVGGLMAVAQLGPIAKDFKIADVPVSLIGLTLPALSFALTLDRILNGLCRPFFGWVSDHLGRENTMFIAFAFEAAGIILLATFATDPVMFVVLSGIVFFGWGEIYSLFPATCTDTYGSKFATVNAGLLYTAKGTAALVIPYTSIWAKASGWHPVFMTAAALNILAALMALLILKPMRSQYTRKTGSSVSAPKLAT
ncbi:MAG: oxalate/formate MFS antiporter [Steroidobacteraceae bacterium]